MFLDLTKFRNATELNAVLLHLNYHIATVQLWIVVNNVAMLYRSNRRNLL